MPDAVEMPWLETVPAALACFYPGQGGGEAIARILFGEQNPCGKLSATMPAMIEDIPGWHSYPGEHGRHLYSEGIFVGYRYYDLKSIAPAFPFGHGLSYTTFSYEDLAIDASAISPGSSCNVTLTIRNTGTVPGKKIVQIYVRPVAPGLKRPIRELKAFAKIALQPGESRSVTLSLAPRDFHIRHVAWKLGPPGRGVCHRGRGVVAGHSVVSGSALSRRAAPPACLYRAFCGVSDPGRCGRGRDRARIHRGEACRFR
ncbi:hypothetical protein T190_07605 [Sinorhizobium meliloti CCBAU 01290]|nr:hypothetical protein T190_07605 [Sinorhizobium meliloti CCBAU 01290]